MTLDSKREEKAEDMVLSEAFRERLKEMEHTRNRRLSLLYEEKATQATKSQILSSKQTNIAFSQRRCWLLHQKIATQNFNISALRSQLLRLESSYNNGVQTLRVLKSEVEELEEVEKERNSFYGEKTEEMEEFKKNVEDFNHNCRHLLRQLGNRFNQIQSNLVKHQGKGRCNSNRESEVTTAEMQKHRLLAQKANLDKDLGCNRKILAQLQQQLEEKREYS